MKGIGFSLKGLLVAVTMVAVGVFALLNASWLWISLTGLLTTLLLLTSLIGGIYCRGRSRAFSIGFAVSGWGYLLLAYAPEPYSQIASNAHVLDDFARKMQRTVPIPPGPEPEWWVQTIIIENGQNVAVVRDKELVKRVAKLLLAWIFAALGGFTASYLWATQERKP